jgi:hypothetical protein
MNIGDIIGRKVMILLHSAKGLQSLGIDETNKYCTVVGHDHIGLWVENPSYEETPIRDAEGKLIPPSGRTPQHYVAHILIPWSNVRSVVYFPERAREAALESEEVRPIGAYL